MTTFDLDALYGETLTVAFGGTEHVVVLPSAADEYAWSRLIATLASGKYTDEDLANAAALIARWVPTLDTSALPGRVLVKLGTWITSGGELGNASGAAGHENSSPSSRTSTPKTRAK